MNTREKINVYATHGGAWEHLAKEMVKEGLSQYCADEYIKFFRKKLGPENAKEAIELYDQFIECSDKEYCDSFFKLKYL